MSTNYKLREEREKMCRDWKRGQMSQRLSLPGKVLKKLIITKLLKLFNLLKIILTLKPTKVISKKEKWKNRICFYRTVSFSFQGQTNTDQNETYKVDFKFTLKISFEYAPCVIMILG